METKMKNKVQEKNSQPLFNNSEIIQSSISSLKAYYGLASQISEVQSPPG